MELPADKALIPLFKNHLVSKMPQHGRESGLGLKGTFREQFTFHSWQAELDCQAASEREADSQTRLAP